MTRSSWSRSSNTNDGKTLWTRGHHDDLLPRCEHQSAPYIQIKMEDNADDNGLEEKTLRYEHRHITVYRATTHKPIMHTWKGPKRPQIKLPQPTNLLTNEVFMYNSGCIWMRQTNNPVIKATTLSLSIHAVPCELEGSQNQAAARLLRIITISHYGLLQKLSIILRWLLETFCNEQLITTHENIWGSEMTLMKTTRLKRGSLCESETTLIDNLPSVQGFKDPRRPRKKSMNCQVRVLSVVCAQQHKSETHALQYKSPKQNQIKLQPIARVVDTPCSKAWKTRLASRSMMRELPLLSLQRPHSDYYFTASINLMVVVRE